MIGDRIVTDDYEQYELKLNCWRTLLGLLHKCCGKFFGKKPCKIDEANSIDDDREIFRLILDKYKNHPSLLVQNAEPFQTFYFNKVSLAST